MISLILTLMLNGVAVESQAIDNVQFQTVQQCEIYKKRMKYTNTARLMFKCTAI